MTKLGVNIDHVATLRQARREFDPDPVQAAMIAVKNGADTIVCHLREDRRHIQDQDVFKIKQAIGKPLNLEMSLRPDIIRIALKVKPDYVMFVPERREEVTTEGGLDVIKNFQKIKKAAEQFNRKNIIVSVFIDPKPEQILKAKEAGVSIVELHTGAFARARTRSAQNLQLKKLKMAAQKAKSLGLTVHAGHGLKYHNTKAVAQIKDIDELNIGHSIISESIFIGLPAAVRRMKKIVSMR
ncbi:MAG: pyridoxine 5'-phosphate synthase [Candidatus Omnitrophica bacterium]|nr:pyridoxine 5'-phosphate synthase [Candidatus Omnitrophota bacterium]